MMRRFGFTDLREGHEELNLPCDASLDTPIYRDAYRDLIKCKSTKNVSYNEFLHRMKERNIASRKKEFERRRIVLDPILDKTVIKAFKETKAAAAAITAEKSV